MHWIAWLLAVIGGLNWGLIGVSYFTSGNWNVVNLLLGSWPLAEAIVYILVGLSALALIFDGKCKACMAGGGQMM
ncbi:MAG: DUF378 domain-containing protein [Patescibacteria group bacterium]